MPHIYKVGQILDLSSAPLRSNRPEGPCRVMACLPYESGQALYRVQCLSERNERVVEESDLSRGTGSMPPVSEKEDIISIAISRR